MKTILLVDDEPTLRETIADALRDGLPAQVQCEVVPAESGIRAIELLARQPFDLVVTDLCMPQVDGFKLLDHLARHHPRVPVVAMTGYGFPEVDQFVQNLGARLFLEKPFPLRTLLDAVTQLLAAGGEESSIQGFSLPSFLQLMELDKKSSLVHVRAGDAGRLSGQLGFMHGQLIHATAKTRGGEEHHWQGESAVSEMLGWHNLQLHVSHLGQPPDRNVFTPLSTLLMDSAHAFDERMAAAG